MATLLSLPREILDHIASFLPRRTGFELALCCRDLVDVGLRAAYRSVSIETYTGEQWANFRVAVSLRPAIADWVIVLTIEWCDNGLSPGHPVLSRCETLNLGLYEDPLDIDHGLAFAAAVCPNVLSVSMTRPLPNPDIDFSGRPRAPSSLRQLKITASSGVLDFGRRFGVCGPSLRSLYVSKLDKIPITDLLTLGPACPLLERLEIWATIGPLRRWDRKPDCRTVFPSLISFTIWSLTAPAAFYELGELPCLRSLTIGQDDRDDDDDFSYTMGHPGFSAVLSGNASALHRNASAFPSLAEINVVLRFRSDAFVASIGELEDWACDRGIAFGLRYEPVMY